jgi:hypothetical protein
VNEVLEVPLGSGTNESVDDNLTPFDQCRVCNNAVFPNNVVAQKRPGLTTIYTNTGTPTLVRLGKHQDELLAFDNSTLYGYSSKELTLVSRGGIPPFLASRRLLGGGNQPSGSSPFAPMGGVAEDPTTKLRVEVWSDGRVTQAVVYDPVNKVPVRRDVLADSAGNGSFTRSLVPHVSISGSVAFAMWWDAATTEILYSAIDLTNPSQGWSNATSIGLGSVVAGVPWDMTCVPGAGLVAVVLGVSGTGVQLYVFAISGRTLSFDALLTPDLTTTVTFTCAAVFADADGIVVAWGRVGSSGGTDTYKLRWAAYDTMFGTLQIPIDITSNNDVVASLLDGPLTYMSVGIARYTGHGSGSTAEYVLCWSREYRSVPSTLLNATNIRRTIPAFYSLRMTRSLSNAGNIHGPVLGYKQHSKPLALSIAGTVRVFCLAVFYDENPSSAVVVDPVLQPVNATLVLMEPELTQVSDNWMVNPPRGVCAPLFAGDPILPAAMDVASSTTTTGMLCIGHEQSSATNINVTSLLFDAAAPGLYQNLEFGSWTWIAASTPMIYDGQIVCEAGFVQPPITPQVQATITSAGALTSNRTMQYCAVYSWQDDAGNVHRSMPSPLSASIDCNTGGGASAIEVTVYPCRMTYRQNGATLTGAPGANPIKVEIYRNTASTPDIWQLATAVENDPTNVTAVSLSDTNTDADLAARPFLYTTGGAVPASPCPSLTALTVHADRLFGISENGYTAFFTTTLVQAESPRFSDSFTLDWPEGAIQAQWSLENRMHAATDSRIFSLFGSGPSDTNTGNDFSPVQPWQDDFGVVDPRAIASFQHGTVFNSKRGLMLEGRDGSYTWIGNQVQRTQTAYPIVTSVCPLTSDGVIRVTLKLIDAAGTGGLTLHWDHRRSRWSTHYTTSLGFFKSGAEGCIEVAGTYYLLLNNGANKISLLKETPLSSLDDGTWVPLEVTTGWAHPGGLQGWSRLDKLLLDSDQQSPHSVTIQVARDYSSTFDAATGTWSDTDLSGLTVERVLFQPQTQALASFSVAISDGPPGTPDAVGTGPIYKMLTAAYRIMGGQYRNVATALRR